MQYAVAWHVCMSNSNVVKQLFTIFHFLNLKFGHISSSSPSKKYCYNDQAMHYRAATQDSWTSDRMSIRLRCTTIIMQIQFRLNFNNFYPWKKRIYIYSRSLTQGSEAEVQQHMSAEQKWCFSNWPKGETNIFQLRTPHWFRGYVSPNQIHLLFWTFWTSKFTNFKTRLWTRDMCHVYSEGTCG